MSTNDPVEIMEVLYYTGETWIPISSNCGGSGSSLAKMKKGTSKFNGINGTRPIYHNCATLDYSVIITPSDKTIGDIGEYFVEKHENDFIVYNTGRNATTAFDWVVVSYSESKNGGILCGQGTFGGRNGSTIDIGEEVNVDYTVNVVPVITDIDNVVDYGTIGEYYISQKTPTSFTVINLGSNTKMIFDWIILTSGTIVHEFEGMLTNHIESDNPHPHSKTLFVGNYMINHNEEDDTLEILYQQK